MINANFPHSEDLLNTFKRYNQLKIDLFKISQCLNCCTKKSEEEFYKDVAIEYSKKLKNLAKLFKQEYGINYCCNCNKKDNVSASTLSSK